jgi:hypothetical protein
MKQDSGSVFLSSPGSRKILGVFDCPEKNERHKIGSRRHEELYLVLFLSSLSL